MRIGLYIPGRSPPGPLSSPPQHWLVETPALTVVDADDELVSLDCVVVTLARNHLPPADTESAPLSLVQTQQDCALIGWDHNAAGALSDLQNSPLQPRPMVPPPRPPQGTP